jgi:hypothetical protein
MITTSQIQLISAVLPVPPGRSEDSKETENRNIEGQMGKDKVRAQRMDPQKMRVSLHQA